MMLAARVFLGVWATWTVAGMAGCAQHAAPPPAPPVRSEPAPVAVVSPPPVAAPASAPAVAPGTEALAQGLKAYRAARYARAELQFKSALQAGLGTPAEVSNAYKHLAFIYCTSKRQRLCAEAFKAARAADPRFVLSKAEAGHPMWGPIYRSSVPALKR